MTASEARALTNSFVDQEYQLQLDIIFIMIEQECKNPKSKGILSSIEIPREYEDKIFRDLQDLGYGLLLHKRDTGPYRKMSPFLSVIDISW